MNKVYEAIAAVQGELAQIGIAKNRKNKQGEGYMFRGIDDVYGALAPLLSKHQLCVLPRIIERECIERTSKNGNALFYTTVTAEFDLVSAEDSSKHTVRSYGESMDSGDKGTNKAMSTAYKTMAFMAFCIPTEGDNDTENQTHEVQPRQQQGQQRQQQQQSSPDLITEAQAKMIFAKMKAKGLEPERLKVAFKVESSKNLLKSQMNDILAWIDGETA